MTEMVTALSATSLCPINILSLLALALAWHRRFILLSTSINGLMSRVLENDGSVPVRDEIDTLSVLFDMRVLPLNHSTSTLTSVSTALPSVVVQIIDKLVPAYKTSSEMLMVMLGLETTRYRRKL